jgi:glycosyltransferase involved in cell wall biosynthesis
MGLPLRNYETLMLSLVEREIVSGASQPATRRRKVRLAHVQLLSLLSGVQRVSLDLLRSLDPAEFDRHLICREAGPLSDAAEQAGVTCHFVPEMVRPISPWNDWPAYHALQTLFRAERFDIVHTNSTKPGVLGRLAARAAQVPVVIHTVHGFAFPAARSWATRRFFRWAEQFCQPATDALICLNESDRVIAREQLHFPDEKLHVVSNGIDTDQMRPPTVTQRNDARKLLGISNDRPIVAMVGRLWPQKDPLCFVEMADRLIRDGVNANFCLIGDGELRGALEEQIAQRGLSDHVFLLGWRDDVPRLLHGIDLFVLTSRWEGLPLVILEAMACGVPVVASNIPGNRDAVDHGCTGLLAEAGSPATFAAAVASLLNDNARRNQFSAAARAAAEQHFSLAAHVGRIRSLYHSLYFNSAQSRR